MAGRIDDRHGRSIRQVTAISNALALLTNIVMAWNTQAMQAVISKAPPGSIIADRLTHIASAREDRFSAIPAYSIRGLDIRPLG